MVSVADQETGPEGEKDTCMEQILQGARGHEVSLESVGQGGRYSHLCSHSRHC